MNEYDDRRDDDVERTDEFELTPAEEEAFDRLPRDRVPGPTLEDRVVGVLRQRGVLAQPHSRVIELTPRRIVMALAACLALMMGGFALGQWTGAHQDADHEPIPPEIRSVSLAAQVQQAGSAYVTALERFADRPDSINGEQAVQGREVALTTLCTAAGRVTHLVPKSQLAMQLSATLETDLSGQTASEYDEIAIREGRVIQF